MPLILKYFLRTGLIISYLLLAVTLTASGEFLREVPSAQTILTIITLTIIFTYFDPRKLNKKSFLLLSVITVLHFIFIGVFAPFLLILIEREDGGLWALSIPWEVSAFMAGIVSIITGGPLFAFIIEFNKVAQRYTIEARAIESKDSVEIDLK